MKPKPCNTKIIIKCLTLSSLFIVSMHSRANDLFVSDGRYIKLSEAVDSKVKSAEEGIRTLNNRTEYAFKIGNLTRYDSNPVFLRDEQGVLQNITNAQVNTKSYFDNFVLYFTGGLSVVRSSKPDLIFNQEYPELISGVIKNWENSSLDVSATYNEASARRFELAETGLIFKDNTRIYKGVDVKYSKQIDSTLEFLASINRSNTDYKIKSNGIVPYDLFRATLGLNKVLSEKWSILSNFAYTDYTPDSGSIKYYLVNVGFNYLITDMDTLTMLYGRSNSTIQSSATGSNYSIKYNHKADSYDYSLDYAQSTNPSPLGTLLLNKTFSFVLNKEIDERTSGYLRLLHAVNSNTLVLVSDSITQNGELGLTKKISDDFTLTLNAGLQKIDRGFSTNSNYIGLNLTYNYKR